MARTDLYLKLELDHETDEKPERLASDICRQLLKLYSVRSAEVSNLITRQE
jgi:phosphoribosylformylglycinamidine (FGAM) synthase PurS component